MVKETGVTGEVEYGWRHMGHGAELFQTFGGKKSGVTHLPASPGAQSHFTELNLKRFYFDFSFLMSVASEARRGHHISKTRGRDGCELPCGTREQTQASRRAAEPSLQAHRASYVV